ncbi:hypothetical protein LOTGIDRAFT_226677 [Lottia gigantea]|uniref:15-hydroxyprostaglandin dehydrogenase [NAD(+)] n=1 Tax=Lottia gigantea TaxID=225164 RepID=V4ALY4_LOTGI|nr:hypothetical protein LOTGIDRAFT_226677 [Lottia gigantea]ESO98137.1 hypothetical protein LOTGIDRAFT_226677 [Lottia gigantea]
MDIMEKTAFITGAAQGIGEGFAGELLRQGAKVCIADINTDKANATVNNFKQKYGNDKVFCVKMDVTNPQEFEDGFNEAISRFGNIDIMINNAGIVDESQFAHVIDINYTSVVRGTNLAIAHMNKLNGGKGGTIVNMGSTVAFEPGHIFPVYSGTKTAVVGYTTSWAANPTVKEMGISFSCICPHATDTMMLDNILPHHAVNMPENLKGILADTVGICPISLLAEALTTLLGKENNNGILLFVNKFRGIQFVTRHYNPNE